MMEKQNKAEKENPYYHTGLEVKHWDVWHYVCCRCDAETFVKMGEKEPKLCCDCMIEELSTQ